MNNKKLYIAKAGDYYKIGISDNPEERIKQLQTANPQVVELVVDFPAIDAAECEKRLHEKFAKHRASGEWFELDSCIIDGMIAMYNILPIDEVVDWICKAHKVTLYLMCNLLVDVEKNSVNSWLACRGVQELKGEAKG